jgi:hypothetical protein
MRAFCPAYHNILHLIILTKLTEVNKLSNFSELLQLSRVTKTTILAVVMYGCETWSVALREEHRLRVFENRALREYLDLKGRKTDRGENRIMMNFTACILHQILLG